MKKKENKQIQSKQIQSKPARNKSAQDKTMQDRLMQKRPASCRSVRSRHTQEEKELFQELDQYLQSGCRIYLNGKPSAPERIVAACLREESNYMRDFVIDDQERIRRIDFIKINHKK